MSRRVLQYPRRQRPLQKHAMPKTANSSWRFDGVSCGGCGDTCRWPESLQEERSRKKPRSTVELSQAFCFIIGSRDLRAKERPHVALSCSIFLPVLSTDIHNSNYHRQACTCSDAGNAFVLETYLRRIFSPQTAPLRSQDVMRRIVQGERDRREPAAEQSRQHSATSTSAVLMSWLTSCGS